MDRVCEAPNPAQKQSLGAASDCSLLWVQFKARVLPRLSGNDSLLSPFVSASPARNESKKASSAAGVGLRADC